MKKIFITGGAGYIGSKLVPKLLESGYEVTVLDLMIYGENVLDNHKKLKKIKGDIRNKNLLEEIIPGHDAVLHLACISNDPSFELNPSLGKSINYDAFEPLVKVSVESKVHRFIYASSSSVYGINSKGITESIKITPKNANCKNYAFDVTPAKFITKIITERKVVDANKSSISKLVV